MTIEVQTLGGFQVTVDGQAAEGVMNRPTCSAALVYLATEGKATRDTVLATLWPDRSESRARHALSQTLYQLRRILGREALPAKRQELRLADSVRVDAAEFVLAVRQERYVEAVAFYGGRFLEGWHFRSAAPFEHWVDRQVERFASLHRTACRRSIRTLLDANDRSGARALAEHWAEVEPEGAEAHRELIRLLVKEGEHDAARACFAAFERRLAELDMTPGPDVVEAVAPARARRPSTPVDVIGRHATSQPRIVVLPFAHTGPARYAHLTYGLADETTVRLSRHPGLAVIARSSAFTFMGRARSLIEIGAEMRVDHVLEGTVHWDVSGPSTTAVVSPQLVRVADGRQLWAAQLETDGEDVHNLPVRLADRALSALGLPPSGDRKGTAEPPDPEAYELYVRGLQHWHQRTSAGISAAIDLFIRAIELEQGYASAYAGLALAYAMMPSFVGDTPNTWMPRARRAAERALDLDPDNAEGHLAMGIIAWSRDLDEMSARRHWDRTVELEPSNAQAMVWRAHLMTALRRADEARHGVRQALALDPLSVSTNFDAGLVYWCLRDQTQADTQLRRVLQIDPSFTPAAFILGVHHLVSGEIDDTRREWSRIGMFGPTWRTLLETLDDPPRAIAAIDRIVEISPRPVHWYATAQLYLLFGEPERALFWINAHLRNLRGDAVGYPTGGPSLFLAASDPIFDSIRSAPEFPAFLRTLHL
jgi:DNA-binding SARP family transcriptional activator/TolB-like protein/tetratricopeptide (TPR) repeat protein